MERNSAQAQEMKSDEEPFLLSNVCNFWRKKWYMLWLTGIFFISEGFKDFLNQRLSLIVPLKMIMK